MAVLLIMLGKVLTAVALGGLSAHDDDGGSCSSSSDPAELSVELLQKSSELQPQSQPQGEDPFSTWPDAGPLRLLYSEFSAGSQRFTPSQAELAGAETSLRTTILPQEELRPYESWEPNKAYAPTYRQVVGAASHWSELALHELWVLMASGLTEQSKVLDVGCGSLRLGQFLIPFLLRGHYHCIEPNIKPTQDAFKLSLGYDLLQRKLPQFAVNFDFKPPPGLPAAFGADESVSVPEVTYDFIFAESIFSHTAEDMLDSALASLRRHMGAGSVFLASFVLDEDAQLGPDVKDSQAPLSGWYYSGQSEVALVRYRRERLAQLLAQHGLAFHVPMQLKKTPTATRQTWLAIRKTA